MFVGFLGSLGLVSGLLRGTMEGRPNSDRVQLGFGQHHNASAESQDASFQVQNAVRLGYIAPHEYRELRAKYVLPADFAFSMLLPLSLALIYIALTSDGILNGFLIGLTAAAVTTLLISFALDRRHKYRSEYRTVISENRRPGEKSKRTPPLEEPQAHSPSGTPTSQPMTPELAALMAQIMLEIARMTKVASPTREPDSGNPDKEPA